MIKLYTEKEYADMACRANAEAKKLIVVTDEIQVPIYNEQGEIIGYETCTQQRLEIVDNPDNFDRCFFNTSLGYVKREVTMANGEHHNFLCDIATGLKPGAQILVYDRNLNQSMATVTEQFIAECIQQATNDFYNKN